MGIILLFAFIGLIYGAVATVMGKVSDKTEETNKQKKEVYDDAMKTYMEADNRNRYRQPERPEFERVPSRLPFGPKILSISAIVFTLIVFIRSFLVIVGPQEVGVVVTPKGVSDKILTTGWNIVSPLNSVKMMDKTVWVYTLTKSAKEGAKSEDDAIWAPTADGIKMGFDISVNWHIDPNRADWIYTHISGDQDKDGRYHWMEEHIIRPAIKSIMPNTISNYSPIDCYSGKRQEIQGIVEKALITELKKSAIIIDMAQIRDVYYNHEYEASINQKKLEEQKVMTLQQITKQKEEELKQANIDKDMKIAQAEGEAKALQIKGNSISSNPKIIQLQWIEKWDGHLPTYTVGGNTSMLMQMPSNDK